MSSHTHGFWNWPSCAENLQWRNATGFAGFLLDLTIGLSFHSELQIIYIYISFLPAMTLSGFPEVWIVSICSEDRQNRQAEDGTIATTNTVKCNIIGWHEDKNKVYFFKEVWEANSIRMCYTRDFTHLQLLTFRSRRLLPSQHISQDQFHVHLLLPSFPLLCALEQL